MLGSFLGGVSATSWVELGDGVMFGWVVGFGFGSRKYTTRHMMSMAALVDRWTMPPAGRCNGRCVGVDMQYTQDCRVPDAPEVDSDGQEAGGTGLNGHGAVDGIAS